MKKSPNKLASAMFAIAPTAVLALNVALHPQEWRAFLNLALTPWVWFFIPKACAVLFRLEF
jgi:hypothetical protein